MKCIKLLNAKFLPVAFLFLLILNEKTFSQIAIEWQKCLRVDSTSNTWGYTVAATADGGFIVGCSTSDFGLVKTDSLGNKQWSNTYGGSSNDVVHAVISSLEGGYFMAGVTYSNDGDVTGFHGGTGDAWVVKTDVSGNLLWQKAMGGSAGDQFFSAIQNQAGEYICVGMAVSSDGDLIGLGNGISWMVKLDSTGIILDQVRPTIGNATKIIPTSDNGYAIAGISSAYGLQDFGILKLDSSFNTQWTQVYGGTNAEIAWGITQTSDGSFVVSGGTLSNDIFVSGNHGALDFWVIKLDSAGNFIWQRCLGGISDEVEKNSVVETEGGNYIIAGYYYGMAFSPTDSISVRLGNDDIWMTALDTSGTLLWEKSIGGGSGDGCRSMLKINNREFMLAGWSGSNDHDVSGNSGNWSAWLVKFVAEPNSVTGNLFVDANANLNHDSIEYALTLKKVFETGSNRSSISNSMGNYRVDLPFDGNAIIKSDSLNYYNCIPSLYSKTFTGFNNIDSLNDFAFQPVGTFNDLKIDITCLTNLRFGFQSTFRLTFKNVGTTIQSGDIVLLKNSLLNYASSSLAPALITADSVQWNYTNLNPFESRDIDIVVSVSATFGSLIQSTAKIYPIVGDTMPFDNVAFNRQFVVGSFDPNDISVSDDTIGLTPSLILNFWNTQSDSRM